MAGQAGGQSGAMEAPGLEDGLEEDDETFRESLHEAMTALATQETSPAQVGHACFALQLQASHVARSCCFNPVRAQNFVR